MLETTLECTLFLYYKIELLTIRAHSEQNKSKKSITLHHCMMLQTTQAAYDWTLICSIITSFEGKYF